MTELIIKSTVDHHDPDKPKDCPDFVPLNDGTIRGDKKYCDRSKECSQYNPEVGMGYYSEYHDYYEFYTDENGELKKELVHDYLCTGNFPKWEERMEERKAN